MNKDLINIKNELTRLYNMSRNHKLRQIENNTIYNSDFLFFANILQSNIIQESPYKNIILNYMRKAETYMLGGSSLLSALFLENINNISNKEKEVSLDNNLITFNEMLLSFIKEKEYQEIISKILHFSGPDATISCSKSKNSIIEVNKINLPRININLHEDFRNVYFANQNKITKNFIVLCMDAYIERESEIDSAFGHAKKEKLPIILFCRGISSNAIRSIKQILIKNNIQIYIYVIKFSNEDPFLLSDISKLLKIPMYSVESGATFNTTFYDKIDTRKIRVSPTYIEPQESDKDLIREINDKIKNTHDQDLLKYLFARKKRITSNIVEVKVPESNIKLLNDIRGIIYLYNNAAISGFISYKGKVYPKNIFNNLNRLSNSMITTIKNIGYVLKIK